MAPTPMLLRGLGNVDRKERKPLDYNVLSLALHITEVSTLVQYYQFRIAREPIG